MSVESPCVKVCVLDPVTGWCIGCGRTGDEIAGWIRMPEPSKAALVAVLPDRLLRMTTRAGRRVGRSTAAGSI